MKKLCVLSLVILLSVTLISIEVLATGVSLTGIGGRATVFGGAFRGISNDWSAMYWNPAGLVQIKNMQFGGSLEFIAPHASYTMGLYNGQNMSVLTTNEVDAEAKKFIVPSFGFVYSTGDMAFGLSVFAPFGLGAQWDLFNTSNYNTAYPDIDYDDDLKIIDIHPTFSYKVSEKLSVGVGVSIIHSDIRIQMPKISPSPALAAQQTYAALGIGFNPTNSYVLTDVNLEGSGWGFGGNLGLLYKASEDLHIGVSARYYNDSSLDGSFTADSYLVNDQTAQATLGGALQLGAISQAQFNQLIVPFSGAVVPTTNDQNVTATMPLPMNIGVGFAYYGIENLMLSLDLDWTQWSSWDVINIDMSNGSQKQLTENWEDVIRIAVGLEYTMDNLSLRGGFYTENNATIDETLTPSIPDVNRRNVIIGGIGYTMGNINFHLLGEYFFIGERTVNDWVFTTGAAPQNDNFAGVYNASTFTLMGGFDFNF